jgi:Mg2+ and Co2+ transporter CorA
MPNAPIVYDSFDPKLPNLPDSLLHTNESDNFSEDEHPNDSLSETNEDRASDDNTAVPTYPQSGMPGVSLGSVEPKPRKERRKRNRHAHRNRRYSSTGYSSSQARERISWEPGIDINSSDVILSSFGSSVTVTDYNEDRYRVERIDVETNMRVDADLYAETDDSETLEGDDDGKATRKGFREGLRQETKKGNDKLHVILQNRPSWSKVRWINVNGLSWETIVTLATFFNLHKLAIEDMIDIPTRTKIDFYPDCLFGVIAVAKLVKESKQERSQDEIFSWLNLFSSGDFKKNDRSETVDLESSVHKSMSIDERLSKYYKIRHLNDSFKPSANSKGEYSKRRHRYTNYLNNQKPLSYRDLFVGVEQCSFFLLKKGVVLTFFESSGDDIENAILSRISKSETILKKSCDSSILLQNILDSIVDIMYPILTAYRKRLDEFEIEALMNPNISHTRKLHLLYGELENLRRSILPITSLINSIREVSQQNSTLKHDHMSNFKTTNIHYDESMRLISPLSEIYYSDIVDHTMMFTAEIEGMINNTQNLIDLIFNTISTDTNDSMRQLSWITVIFLPMSFWTGYYGMNFEIFTDLENNVSEYWKVAVPFSAILIIILTWNFLKRYFRKSQRFVLDVLYVLKTFRAFKSTEKANRSKSNISIQKPDLV